MRLRFFLILLFTQVILSYCPGQCPVFATFRTQAQIDAFGQNYPNCDSLNQSLYIEDDNTDQSNITNLLGLSGLKYVHSVEITKSQYLTSLKGLDSLKHIRDGLRISYCDNLKSLKELHVEDTLWYLHLIHNINLKSLHGLESLDSVTGSIIINENISLLSLTGLENLVSARRLTIKSNSLFKSLFGLNDYFNIHEDIEIKNNIYLTECDRLFICEHILDTSKVTDIANNGLNCLSLQNVIDHCTNQLSSASGQVYFDYSCNGVLDSIDRVVPNHIIQNLENNFPILSADEQGIFNLEVLPNDTLLIAAKPIPHFSSLPPYFTIQTDASIQQFDSINFALCPDTLFHDLQVTISQFTPPRPGFYVTYQVCIQNGGTYFENANLVFDFQPSTVDSLLTILSADGGGIVTDTSVVWTLTDISPFEKFCFEVKVRVGVSMPLGTLLFPQVATASIDPIIEIDQNNNEASLLQVVVGSVDPNDKAVDRDMIEFTDHDQPLTYSIRFQNTGTYPAAFITLLDTLDKSLDIHSFQMISASHPYTISFPDTNIIRWRFDDIYLPDSLENEPESHGFVRYKMNARGGLEPNTRISNKASIYFDYNNAVNTNKAQTVIEFPESVDPVHESTFELKIYPNPAQNEINVSFRLEKGSNVNIELLSLDGHILEKRAYDYFEVGEHLETISLSNLPTGMYIVRVMAGKENEVRKIFVR